MRDYKTTNYARRDAGSGIPLTLIIAAIVLAYLVAETSWVIIAKYFGF